jgi:hypothetical protein
MIHETHTDIQTTKICYIEDINKAQRYLLKRPLSTEEFDFLYDQDLDFLEVLLCDFEITIKRVDEFVESVNNLEKR